MKNVALIFSLTVAVASANPILRGSDNDPKFIVNNALTNFSSLPLHGELSHDKTPWASSFWPNVYGGIAFRWNGHYQGDPSFAPMHNQVDDLSEEIEELEKKLFNEELTPAQSNQIALKVGELKQQKNAVNFKKSKDYKTYFFDLDRPRNAKELALLSQADIDRLSPAEKFDVYMYLKTGKENHFKLTRDVLGAASPSDAYWEGICHGWSSASLEFGEPEAQSFSSRGLTVNFGSSDLKALLSYYHAAITKNWITNKKVLTGRVGERCGTPFTKDAWFIKDGVEYYKTVANGKVAVNKVPEDCVDTNAGSFHIVLANMIALQNQGFSAEVVRDSEVWNQPVYKYETEVVNESSTLRPWASAGASKQVEVKTSMYYANDGGRMFWIHDGSDDEFYAWWEQTTGTDNYRFDHKEFRYILDLDKNGNIIGGQWLSYERPDFLWHKKSRGFIGTGTFYGIVNYLDDLKDLVQLQ